MKVFRIHLAMGTYNMSGKNIFGFILFLVIQQTIAEQRGSYRTIMQSIMSNYDRSEPPNMDEPTEVKIGIYMRSLSVDVENQQLSAWMYIRHSWNDPRFKFDPEDGPDKIVAATDDIDSIWKPDLFVRNTKEATFLDVPSTQKLARISSNGDVWYVPSISGTFSCTMKLQKYPFDIQHCGIMFESYGYTKDTLYFSWLTEPIDVDPGLSLPGYVWKDSILYDCSQNYTSGSFPCLEVRIIVDRNSGEFVKQYFMPSLLLVILSWVGFWIRINDSTARILPGFLLLLALMVLAHAARGPVAGISHLTTLDIWMGTCVLMVLFSILQSVVVYYLNRKNEEGQKEVSSQTSRLPEKIDFFSRIIFPCVFLVFNIIYWSLFAS